ncbi:alpha/beta hydrolase [Undibacterium sp. CY22W]|uniref:Alpha/beta hydrolase n=2 Tax=Undibacterium curvum TaxID=2762294 RepID=A0ABR7A0K5_9BURK|nr:alpha/beta hydrolase [Undibacterium curvum]
MLTLVLLPGMDGTGDLFTSFMHALGAEFNIIVVRYPTDKTLNYRELLAHARRSLPTDEPYFILGESFSGPLAISLAAETPSHLCGVILCATFARNPRPYLTPFKSLLAVAPVHWMPPAVLSWALLGAFGTRMLRSDIAQAVGRVAPAVLRTRLQMVASLDVSAQLSVLVVPCLYLQATHDRLVPESAAEHIKSILPQVSLVRINAPHCLLQTVPENAASVVSTFLRESILLKQAADIRHNPMQFK